MRLITLCLSLLLAVVLPRSLRAEGEAAPMSEQQFIELAGAEKPGDDNAGGETGRPMEPAEGTKEGKEEEGTDSSDEEEPGSEGSDDDEEEGGDTAEEPEAGAGSDDDDEEGEQPKGEKKKQKKGAKGAKADDAEEPTGDEDELDAEFQKALEAEGASPSLEDIPEAARPIVAKKLRDLDAGFTRATQRLAADRTAANAFRAEERFRKANPERFIVSMLMENPALSEKVNAIVNAMDEGENTTVIEGHKAIVEKARRDAADAEVKEGEKAQQHEARIERFITLGRAAARANGVPFQAGVEEGIAAHIAIHGDISEAEIRAIAQAKAKVFKSATRENRRNRSGEFVRNKVEDRKKAPLKIRPGTGTAPTPGGKRVAKNDQEFIEEFAGRSS